MTKVNVDLAMLRQFAELSIANGTAENFIRMMLEWGAAAEAKVHEQSVRIAELEAELNDTRRNLS